MTPDVTAPAPAAQLAKATAAGQAPSDGLMPSQDSTIKSQELYASKPLCDLAFTLLVDKVSYRDRTKPRGAEMGVIRNRLAQPGACVTVDVKGLEEFVRNGHTIMPAICRSGTKKENWQAHQLFFLDFDNDASLSERGLEMLEPLDAVQRAFDKRLDPLLLYFTHSATVKPYLPRYRMVFALSEPSSDMGYVEQVGNALLSVFPEADAASIRPTQMFLSPGKEVWPCWTML